MTTSALATSDHEDSESFKESIYRLDRIDAREQKALRVRKSFADVGVSGPGWQYPGEAQGRSITEEEEAAEEAEEAASSSISLVGNIIRIGKKKQNKEVIQRTRGPQGWFWEHSDVIC